MALDQLISWFGIFEGIQFEIRKFKRYDNSDAWTFYVLLDGRQVPDEYRSTLLAELDESDKTGTRFAYSSAGIASLEWHYGITFYEQTYNAKGEISRVKAGCDYQHIWDEGHSYDVDDIEMDVKTCIKSLWEAFPNLLVWNPRDGSFEPRVVVGEVVA